MAQNYGLGRGLSSLIPQKKINRDDNTSSPFSVDNGRRDDDIQSSIDVKKENVAEVNFNQGVLEVDINKISANPYQPRVHFDEMKLKELSDSIKEHGVLQPLVVTKNDNGYDQLL
ncbi:MAG: ParB-like protein [Candidatus Moranbacteria bacterium GW2011_GWE2_35_164]|nr:MAG: ParB-like protein [Candidatus Moranbacteria bacterium GW2011_GWE2_35_164]